MFFLGIEVYINLSNKFRNCFVDGPKARYLKTELTSLINIIVKHGHSNGIKNFYDDDNY